MRPPERPPGSRVRYVVAPLMLWRGCKSFRDGQSVAGNTT